MNTDKLTEITKLSDLIDLAVADAVACQRDPRYKLDMNRWHTPLRADIGPAPRVPDQVCHVCLAGAVIARTCGAPAGQQVDWNHFSFPREVQGRLLALNTAREGYLWSALETLRIWDPYFPEVDLGERRAVNDAGRPIVRNYGPDQRAPWRMYHLATNALRRIGL